MKRNIIYILTMILSFNISTSKWITYIDDKDLKIDVVKSVKSDSSNNIWIANGVLGILYFDSNKWIANPFGSECNEPTSIAIDSKNNIWCSNLLGFIYKYDGLTWHRYQIPLDTTVLVSSITLDNDENIWIATCMWEKNTYCAGIFKFDGSNFTSYSFLTDTLINYGIRDIIVDKNNTVWAVGSSSVVGEGEDLRSVLFKYAGKKWSVFTKTNSGFKIAQPMCLALDSLGNLWIGGNSQLQKYDGVNWTNYDKEIDYYPSDWFLPYEIAIDENNVLWIAANRGLSKFDGVNWTHFYSSDIGIPNGEIHAVHIDQYKRIWIGSIGSVAFYEEDPESIITRKRKNNHNFSQNMPNPFSNTTEIIYSLPKQSSVEITIYNSIGMPIRELVNNRAQARGEHKITFDAGDLPAGVYYYTMQTPDFVETKQMIILK